ncbi:MAG TPA: bifunctional transcriptional activator/DNA repair enzyme AdaA, partial [Geminicoccaceae bacterium]|nr:bifunctional transcriptional activator/DNA repair enzyme AdaA [Geminicoccaceae bacterium]
MIPTPTDDPCTDADDDDARWRAVLARDGRADGRFVYAVVTTGIYCRPTCPSRRPARRHVELFATCRDAERAGFRACKRCRPAAAGGDERVAAIRRACALIEAAEEPPSLADLAATAGMSRFHFHRLFKRVVGVTPREYAAARRLDHLRRELEAGEPVASAIYGAGFGSSSRVYEAAADTLGMTPA